MRILLEHGTLLDGTGAPPVTGDLLIDSGRVAAIGAVAAPADSERIDCRGLVVAPGFIDAHSHSDLQVRDPHRREKIRQGVTSEVVGNCGFSPYPVPADRTLLHQFANGIFCGDDRWGWPSARAYLADTAARAAENVYSLVGHGSLRIARVGHRLGLLPEADLDWMEHTLSEALQEGACGFSTGLMYSPGASAPFDELERLCRVVARHGKTYATHIRDYADRLVEAVDEQLDLARRTGCRLQISHLQAVGPRNWPKQRQALDRIEAAAATGVDVAFDCYPYVAGSTVMTQLLPQWALDGGIEGLLSRLADGATRARIAAETEAALAQGWPQVFVSAVGSQANQPLVGRHIAEVAADRRCEPAEVVLEVIEEERGRVNVLEMNQSEANLRETLSHPLSNIISDGFYVTGRPHPRLFGTFPFLLGEISRHRGWLTLPEAIRKITDQPARRFGMAQRGRLAPGFHADITVFDPGEVSSPATYQQPELPPLGIRHVFREGVSLL